MGRVVAGAPATARIADAPPTDPFGLQHAVAALQRFGATPGAAFEEREGEALTLLYRHFAGTLLHLARRVTGSTDDAQDVVQEVFTNLPKTLQHYRPGYLAGWLRCVTARAALMCVRKRTRRREESFTAIANSAWDVAAPEDLDAHTTAGAVRLAVNALREPLRQVVVLLIYAELPHQEIAGLLGISPNASEVRFCRAIKQLRALFAGPPSTGGPRRAATRLGGAGRG